MRWKDSFIGDAVYERNLTVENQLKIKLDFIDKGTDSDVIATINNYVQAVDQSAELFSLGSYTCMGPVLGGAYLNLCEVGHINLDKFYWTQGYNDLMSLGDDLQFVASSPHGHLHLPRGLPSPRRMTGKRANEYLPTLFAEGGESFSGMRGVSDHHYRSSRSLPLFFRFFFITANEISPTEISIHPAPTDEEQPPFGDS